MPPIGQFIGVYMVTVSIIAVVLTILDKHRARRHQWRVPESTLLGVSALGGSIAMLITMRLIRHKTAKPKFTVGIPLIIAGQMVAIIGVWYLLYR